MVDVIAGFHLNHLTCGVARFNRNLALELRLQVEYFENILPDKIPLLSIKLDEFDLNEARILTSWCSVRQGKYDLMLHGLNNSEAEALVVRNARRIFTCNTSDYQSLTALRNDNVFEAFCPGWLPKSRQPRKSQLSLLSFGMAHKLNDSVYVALRDNLEANNIDYKLLFSTAVHEGYDFEESFLSVESKIFNIFGNNALFLGFLSDQALSNQLEDVDIYATFFNAGYRQNNTSANAAMARGKCLLTNIDKMSPAWLKHENNFLDVNQLEFARLLDLDLKKIGQAGRVACEENLSWNKLLSIVTSK